MTMSFEEEFRAKQREEDDLITTNVASLHARLEKAEKTARRRQLAMRFWLTVLVIGIIVLEVWQYSH